eukprot:gnl/TRDRNA2_/TRDRNA2_40655_c0_seq1.p1 gnl/TRDRNA2_/TRDRNA2_40655_c0~~gnl/TRDRNA2_/TRDRNA2_40655_c0_seq1.p1  ORF type:complete len:116 (+),score=8.71 gnl/TRDRNA2_/TRDRNA2_40655_c0_seq1:148-495(+)
MMLSRAYTRRTAMIQQMYQSIHRLHFHDRAMDKSIAKVAGGNTCHGSTQPRPSIWCGARRLELLWQPNFAQPYWYMTANGAPEKLKPVCCHTHHVEARMSDSSYDSHVDEPMLAF